VFQSSPDWNGSLQSLLLNLKEVVIDYGLILWAQSVEGTGRFIERPSVQLVIVKEGDFTKAGRSQYELAKSKRVTRPTRLANLRGCMCALTCLCVLQTQSSKTERVRWR
jgi:hypothetical protein